MTDAGRNKYQDAEYEKDPHEWYIEPRSCVEQLADAIDFGDDLIWDPSCGRGTIPSVFLERGHSVVGSDIIDRYRPGRPFRFYPGNFLAARTWPKAPPGKRLSIVNNPPFTKAADFMHRALNMIPIHRAAFIVPLDFLCGQSRFGFFTHWTPSHIALCSERPSMPPGNLVSALGDRAFKGGKSNFVWIVFTAPHRWKTQTIWLRPSGQ